MENMFTKFNDEKARYDKRIAELRAELDNAKAEVSQLEKGRAAALKDVFGGSDVHELDTAIRDANKRVSVLEERISFAEGARRDALQKLIPYVDEFKHMEAARAEKAFHDSILVLNRHKAELLRHAVKVAELGKNVDAVHSTANALRKEAGMEPVAYFGFNNPMSVHANPTIQSFDKAAEKHYGVPDWLIEAAFKGKLPSFAKGDSDNE